MRQFQWGKWVNWSMRRCLLRKRRGGWGGFVFGLLELESVERILFFYQKVSLVIYNPTFDSYGVVLENERAQKLEKIRNPFFFFLFSFFFFHDIIIIIFPTILIFTPPSRTTPKNVQSSTKDFLELHTDPSLSSPITTIHVFFQFCSFLCCFFRTKPFQKTWKKTSL